MTQQEQQENTLQKIVIPQLYTRKTLEGRTWKSRERFYQELMNEGLPCEPMLDLVKAIAVSPYALLLHTITSHTDLLVFGYSPFERNRDMIKIESLYREKQLLFTYQGVPWGNPPSWRRLCSADESKRVFERLIIHKLKWVPQEFRRTKASEYEQAGFPLDF